MIASQCSSCIHLINLPVTNGMSKGLKCKAFPSGIPDEIKYSEVFHNKPYPGDQGVMFEQNPDDEFPFEFE